MSYYNECRIIKMNFEKQNLTTGNKKKIKELIKEVPEYSEIMKKEGKSLGNLIDQKQDLENIKGGQQLRAHDIKQSEFLRDGDGVSGKTGNELFVEQDRTVDRPVH